MENLQDMKECVRYSKILERAINNDIYTHRPPMEIEYEKTFRPFLLLKKKKYVFLKYSEDDTEIGKLDSSGIETSRRDGSKLCTDTMEEFIRLFFREKNLEAAVKSVETNIQKLFNMEYPTEYFRIGKRIKKPYEEYSSPKPPQIVLWKKLMDKYGVEAAPKVGQYIYFFCADNYDGKCVKGKNLIWYPEAAKGRINPDLSYYFDAAFVKPMTRLLEHIITPRTLEQLFDVRRYNITKVVYSNKYNLLGNVECMKTKIMKNCDPLKVVALNKAPVLQKTISFKTHGKLRTVPVRTEEERKRDRERAEKQLSIVNWFVPKSQS